MRYSSSRIGFELMLHSFPECSIDDGRLFARIDHAFMAKLTYIDDIAQQGSQPGLGESATGMMLSGFAGPVLGPEPARVPCRRRHESAQHVTSCELSGIKS